MASSSSSSSSLITNQLPTKLLDDGTIHKEEDGEELEYCQSMTMDTDGNDDDGGGEDCLMKNSDDHEEKKEQEQEQQQKDKVWIINRWTGMSKCVPKEEFSEEKCGWMMINYAMENQICPLLQDHPSHGDVDYCRKYDIDPGEAVVCLETKITYNHGAIRQYVQQSYGTIVDPVTRQEAQVFHYIRNHSLCSKAIQKRSPSSAQCGSDSPIRNIPHTVMYTLEPPLYILKNFQFPKQQNVSEITESVQELFLTLSCNPTLEHLSTKQNQFCRSISQQVDMKQQEQTDQKKSVMSFDQLYLLRKQLEHEHPHYEFYNTLRKTIESKRSELIGNHIQKISDLRHRHSVPDPYECLSHTNIHACDSCFDGKIGAILSHLVLKNLFIHDWPAFKGDGLVVNTRFENVTWLNCTLNFRMMINCSFHNVVFQKCKNFAGKIKMIRFNLENMENVTFEDCLFQDLFVIAD